tara:strand:+ start:887 stop:1273 length:387 start_codon:yes stop_codon:yes gene_type:complete
MDQQTAQTILQLPPHFEFTDIKKQYHKLSLIYHPDKNNDKDANQKFNELNTAYNYLINKENNSFNVKNESYDDILFSLINITCNSKVTSEIFSIVKKIVSNYTDFDDSLLTGLSSNVVINRIIKKALQ